MLNKYIKNSLYAAAFLGLATACEPEIERETPDYEQARGDADFSVYVALGNSLTAGVADGALNRAGQVNSYPAIIAEKMAYITPDFEFDQPLLPEGRINGTLVLQEIIMGPPLTPVIVQETNGLSPAVYLQSVSGNFNNMGVPSAKVGDLTRVGYGSAQGNPLFARFASAPTATIVDDAVAQDPTFFTLWIGNNDVLGYATEGGEDISRITEPTVFEESYRAIINQLVNANPSIEGALANIPSLSNAPYFQAVSWNRFRLDATQAATINAVVQSRIEPAVRAGVDSVAKTQVIRAVIEAGTRQRIEAQVRPAVAQGVATQAVYQAAYAEAKAGGATDEQAAAIAQAYIESPEGQNDIENLKNALLNNQAPPELQAIYEQMAQDQIEAIYNSDDVQAQMDATYQAAINNMDDLASVLGEEGAAAVEQNFNSDQVVAAREAAFNNQIAQLKAAGFYPTFAEGPNGFVVDEPNSPTGIRQLNENDLVTLRVSSAPASEFNPTAGDITIPGKYVLDAQEQENVQQAIAAYNEIIAEVAREHTFALVDMNGFFNTVVNSGVTVGGTVFTNAFITGNAFSLDGIHLTQKGYALVATKFIEEINAYYNSNIPLPNLRNYPAVALP